MGKAVVLSKKKGRHREENRGLNGWYSRKNRTKETRKILAGPVTNGEEALSLAGTELNAGDQVGPRKKRSRLGSRK